MVGFVVKAQRIVVECLRLDSGLPIITADFTQSLQAPSLRQKKVPSVRCPVIKHAGSNENTKEGLN